MRGLFRMTAWLVVLQLGHVTVAWACSCVPLEASEVVASGESVVVATIVTSPFVPVAAQASGCGGGDTSNEPSVSRVSAEIEVTEVVAGDAEIGTRVVSTSSDGDACGVDFVAGETWVLQIGPDDSVSLCSGSRRIQGDDDPWLVSLREAAAVP